MGFLLYLVISITYTFFLNWGLPAFLVPLFPSGCPFWHLGNVLLGMWRADHSTKVVRVLRLWEVAEMSCLRLFLRILMMLLAFLDCYWTLNQGFQRTVKDGSGFQAGIFRIDIAFRNYYTKPYLLTFSSIIWGWVRPIPALIPGIALLIPLHLKKPVKHYSL